MSASRSRLFGVLAAAALSVFAAHPAAAEQTYEEALGVLEAYIVNAESGEDNAAAYAHKAIDKMQGIYPDRDLSALRARVETAWAKSHFPMWVRIKGSGMGFWFDKLSEQPQHYLNDDNVVAFERGVADLDPGGTAARMEARIAQDGKLFEKNKKDVEAIRSAAARGQAYADFLAAEVGRLTESARTYQETALLSSRQLAHRSKRLADAGLKLAPRHAALTAAQAKVAAMAKELDAKFEAKVYTGPFHKQHAGKVVFSSAPVVAGKESPAAFKKAFKAGENLYGGIYLDGTLRELVGAGNNTVAVSILVYTGDNKVGKFEYGVPPAEADKSFLAIELCPPDAAKAVSAREAAAMSASLNAGSLTPEEHEIYVKVFLGMRGLSSNLQVAEGMMDFNATSGLDKVTALSEALHARVVSETRMPAAKLKGAALAKSMVAAITAAGWKEKPLRAVVTDAEWTQYRNTVTGILLSRDIAATVAVKDEEGTCKAFDVRFWQEATGNKFGRTQLAIVFGDVPLDCANVGK